MHPYIPGVCPTCNRCPTCGRGGYHVPYITTWTSPNIPFHSMGMSTDATQISATAAIPQPKGK